MYLCVTKVISLFDMILKNIKESQKSLEKYKNTLEEGDEYKNNT